ncbi:hypothetical protein DXU77_18965 [Pseudomonas lactis]|nr:hypothetical protein [Pseudomonas lactis]
MARRCNGICRRWNWARTGLSGDFTSAFASKPAPTLDRVNALKCDQNVGAGLLAKRPRQAPLIIAVQRRPQMLRRIRPQRPPRLGPRQ